MISKYSKLGKLKFAKRTTKHKSLLETATGYLDAESGFTWFLIPSQFWNKWLEHCLQGVNQRFWYSNHFVYILKFDFILVK